MSESNGNGDRMAQIESALLRLAEASLKTSENVLALQNALLAMQEHFRERHTEVLRLLDKLENSFALAYQQFQKQFVQMQEETARVDQRLRAAYFSHEREFREEMRKREQRIDERIDKLVSAIGAFIEASGKPRDAA